MALLEIIIRPLLKAQHEAGRELGRVDGIAVGREQGQSETEQAYQEWIRRQREAGTKFNEDIPPPSCRK